MQGLIVEETLTVQEVATIANVHDVTVYRWISRGLLPSTKTKTGRRRIRPQDLKDFLNDSELNNDK